jgi:transketolase
MMQTRDINQLQRIARKMRLDIVQMVGPNQKGHFGGSCSAADFVAALYFSKMRHDPKNPGWADRDRFLLSKGHSALVQYAALAEWGYFPREELKKLKTLGGMLQGHPDKNTTPGVEANTGSLGQGLSLACGMAAGHKIDGRKSKVYCVLGDGEIAEGQIWEAAMAAAHYKLDNVVAILDRNGLMTNGLTDVRYSSSPIDEKWAAFGWHVQDIDGHNMQEILTALDKADEIVGQPKIIIARTTKARGIPFAEGRAEFHNGIMNAEQYAEACRALSAESTAS